MNRPLTCLKWVGGKSRFLNRIFPLFPKHNAYIEPFVGGASVLLNKEAVYKEVINDIDGDLINFYKMVRDRHEDLIRAFDYELCSREVFEEYAERYRKRNFDDEIQRAKIFFYLNLAGFGGSMKNPSFGVNTVATRRSALRIGDVEALINKVYDRIKNVIIERLPFQLLIRRYDSKGTLFFMDPPYRNLKGYKAGTLNDGQFEDLARLCRNMKSKFLLTINDDPFVRRIFSDPKFTVKTQEVLYQVDVAQNAAKAKELYITNY